MNVTEMSKAEWLAEGARRFGPDPIDWRFVCPVCGNVASGHEFKAAGAIPDAMRCECIGRYIGGVRAFGDERVQPCDYAGYGLFQMSPVRVRLDDGRLVHAFAFADVEASP